MITIYDALMLLIVIVGVVQGAWRGMAWQIAPIASLVCGYIIAYPMSVTAAQYFGKPPLNRLWAMIAIYLVVSMVVYMIVRSIRHSLEQMKLVEFDRHLGAVLGGLKGGLFAVAITIGLITVSDQARDMILKSESSTIAARTMNTISPILPKALNDLVAPYVKNLNDQLPNIADNPTFTFPAPPVLIPNRTATRSDSLAKPKRYTDDGLAPLPDRDDDLYAPPSRLPSRPPASDDLEFGDDFAPPSRSSSGRSSPSSRLSSGSSRNPVPQPADEDDFFKSDPNRAFDAPSPRPR